MKIREYTKDDLARIEEIYEKQGPKFELPDPFDVAVVIRRCLVDEKNKAQLVAFGRVQLNAFLLVDGTWRTPKERLEAIGILEAAMIDEARRKGFDEVTAQVSERFGLRLQGFGWKRSLGGTYHKEF